MKKIITLCLICSVFTLSSCMTYNLSGPEAQNISSLVAPRAFPRVSFNPTGRLFSTNAMKQSLEATGLFVEVKPDWDKVHAYNTKGLYIQTEFNIKKADLAINWLLGPLSIITLGLVPMRIENDFEIISTIYLNKHRVKQYNLPMSNVTFISALPILPGPYLFGFQKEERDNLIAARYITTLFSMMRRDHIVFNN